MHSGIALWGEVSPTRGDKYTYKGHLSCSEQLGPVDLYAGLG